MYADDTICSRPLFAPYNNDTSQQVAYPALHALKGPFAPPRMGAGAREVSARGIVRQTMGFFSFSFAVLSDISYQRHHCLVREDLHEDIQAGRAASLTGVETCIQTGRVLVMLLGKTRDLEPGLSESPDRKYCPAGQRPRKDCTRYVK